MANNYPILEVRGVRLGEGMPKIIVPIAEKTEQEILTAGKRLSDVSYDIVEWRADHFEDVLSHRKTRDILTSLRNEISSPILFTFRTTAEGGEREISPEEYTALCKMAVETGNIDLLDVEAFSDEKNVKEIIDFAHSREVKVILSNHDFDGTPEKAEMVRRLKQMEEKKADIAKLAVMPQNKKDVLALLSATEEAADMLSCPIITMSMGKMGLLSRLSGEVFGSAATFGTAGKQSAPGQMPADGLGAVLRQIHQTMLS